MRSREMYMMAAILDRESRRRTGRQSRMLRTLATALVVHEVDRLRYYYPRTHFVLPTNVMAMTRDEFRSQFRFEQGQLKDLVGGLQLPDFIIGEARCKASAYTAMCLLLSLYAYPKRQYVVCVWVSALAWVASRAIFALTLSRYVHLCV